MRITNRYTKYQRRRNKFKVVQRKTKSAIGDDAHRSGTVTKIVRIDKAPRLYFTTYFGVETYRSAKNILVEDESVDGSS